MSSETKSDYSDGLLRARQGIANLNSMLQDFRRSTTSYQRENVGSSANIRDDVTSLPSAFGIQNHGTARNLDHDFIAEGPVQTPIRESLSGTRSLSDPGVNRNNGNNTFIGRPSNITPSPITTNPTITDTEAYLRSFTLPDHQSQMTGYKKWQEGRAGGAHDQHNQYDTTFQNDTERTRGGDTPNTYTQTPVAEGFHQNNQVGPGTNNMPHYSEATEEGIHTPVQPRTGQAPMAQTENLRPPMAPTNFSGTGAHPSTTGPDGSSIQVDGSWTYDMVYQQQPTLSSIPPAADIPVQEWGPASMGITTPAHYAYHNTNHRHGQISFG